MADASDRVRPLFFSRSGSLPEVWAGKWIEQFASNAARALTTVPGGLE
jgi:hypothetical protein